MVYLNHMGLFASKLTGCQKCKQYHTNKIEEYENANPQKVRGSLGTQAPTGEVIYPNQGNGTAQQENGIAFTIRRAFSDFQRTARERSSFF